MAHGGASVLAAPSSSSPPPSELSASGPGLTRHSPCPLLCPRLTRHPPTTGPGGNGGRGAMPWWKSWTKKYVILCCVCGGTAVMLGVVFIAIYFTLHYYTSSLQYFETIPTYAPAVVLIITGLLVMCFARRRNRYAYLIKLAGGCCLVCAVLCVVITVTTTVIHMNRLQTLRECVYTQKSKTCTCFAGIGDDDSSPRYVFNNTPDCEVVHGSLYTCLRAMFGLSVIGILVCIFSSMLVYQLLSHEKKKMYWEQLEMRRRFFYRQPSHPMYCNCYDDYGFAAPHGVYHWQPWEVNSDRCWPMRGMTPRIGFAGEDGGSQRSILVGSTGHRASGWNWLPWNRNRPQRSAVSGGEESASANGEGTLHAAAGGNEAVGGEAAESQESPRLPLFAVHPYWSVETRFGPRRNGNRRHRSNDAVFHHLNMTPPTRYHNHHQTAPSYAVGDGGTFGNGAPLSFSTYGSLSRHMWGPPPPYSRPPSAENVVAAAAVRNSTPTHLAAVALPAYQERHPTPGTLEMAEHGRVATIESTNLSLDNPVANVATASAPASKYQHSAFVENSANLSSATSDGSYPSDYDVTTGSKKMRMRSVKVSDHRYRRPLRQSVGITKMDGSSTVPTKGVARFMDDHHHSDHHSVVGSKSAPHVWTTSSDYTAEARCHLCHEFAVPVKCCVHVQVNMDKLVNGVMPGSKRRHLLDGSDGTPDSYPSPSTDNCTTTGSSDSFDPEEEEPKSVSNFDSGSVIVSTSPSTPINGGNGYVPDMICARSLPNLNLSLGTTPPSYAIPKCHVPDQSSFDNSKGSCTEADCDNGNMANINNDCASGCQPPVDNNTVVPMKMSESLSEQGGGGNHYSQHRFHFQNKSNMNFSGLSESSPALPQSVPTYLRSAKKRAAGQFLTLETIFSNYNESTSGMKSKSLGNLSPPQDSIIVTFKSIHV